MRLLKMMLSIAMIATLVISIATVHRSSKIFGQDSSFPGRSHNQALVPGKVNYTVVFSIPLGIDSVNYEKPGGLDSESETWGPAGLRIAADNSFLIIDTVGNSILRYSSEGTKIDRTVVVGAEAISDVTSTPSGVFVLDDAGEQPLIHRVGSDGSIQDTVSLPYESRSNGLSGIVANEQGELMVEMRGGSFLATLAGKSQKGKALRGQTFSTELPVLEKETTDRSVGAIYRGQKRIPIRVTNTLGGLNVLGEGKSGDFYVLVEELSNTPTLVVDQTVHHFSHDGVLLGVARIPLSERYTYVRNGVSVAPDGNVYALITRSNRVDVVLLHFAKTATSILPTAEPAPVNLESESEGKILTDRIQSNALRATCRTRDEMIATALTYVNNKTWLTDKNLNGSCSGRIKPRYLGKGEGHYSSVPYKWGGVVTVPGFNSDMAQGSLAGHIPLKDDLIRSCASGVDCSGFVNNCWATSRHTTSTLKNISTQISVTQLEKGDIINRAGVHVAMVESLANGGVYTLEATTYNDYDRVVHIWNGWSRFSGYTFYRYNNVCSTAPAKVATPNINPGSLSSLSSVKATISTSTSGATIRYTTDGTNPTPNSSTYSGPLTFNSTVTLKARAFKNGLTDSDVASATYSIVKRVAKPSINPGSLSSQSSVKATISTSTSGATIRYTTNGADPTTRSPIYSGPLTFKSTVTLKARAFKNGLTDSDVATATYSIGAKPVVDRIRYRPNPAKVSRVVSVDIFGKNFRARSTEVWFVGPGCSGSGCRTNAVDVKSSSHVASQAVLNRTGNYTVNIRNGNGAWVKAGTVKVVK